MKRIYLLFIYACLLATAACHHSNELSEPQQVVWHQQVFAPALAAFYAKHQADTAIYLYDSILHSLKEPYPIAAVCRFSLMADIHFALPGQKVKAINYLDSGLAMMENKQLVKRLPHLYFDILCWCGQESLSMESYNRAFEYYFKAKAIAAQYLNGCDIAFYNYRIAMLLYKQENYQQSANYFKESFSGFEHCSATSSASIYHEQEIADNIGLCYTHLKRYDSAIYYFNQCLDIVHDNKDSLVPRLRQNVEGVVLGNMGKVYVRNNRLDTAITLFRKSIDLNTGRGHDEMDAELVQVQLAEAYQQQEQYSSMFAVLGRLKLRMDTLPNPQALLNWKRLMSNYYEHQQDRVNELRYFKDYINMRDSIRAIDELTMKTNVEQQVKDKEQQVEIVLLKKDGQLSRSYLIIFIALSLVALLFSAFVYMSFRKTSRLNKLIVKQKEQLEQLDNMKNGLFSIISHDMRAPLNSLTTFMHLLEEADITAQQLALYSAQLRKSLDHTSIMMENLLNWAASQLKGFRPRPEQLGITKILALAMQDVRSSAEEKHIAINDQVILDLAVFADSNMLRLVLRNLLSNAVKYSHSPSSITITAVHQQERVSIAISDSGTGMSPEQVSSFNNPNQWLLTRSNRGTANEKGTGLGLHLCKLFIEMLNGSIAVESEQGRGTVFTIELPVNG